MGWVALVLWLVGLASPALGAGSTAGEEFDAAARLYEQGRPADAAAAYARMIEAGTVSVPVYFNQGAAWLQSGNVGRAIVAFRWARHLAPRDSEVRAGLDAARAKVGGGAASVEGMAERAIRWLHPNEWAVAATVAVWLWAGWMILRDASPRMRGAVPGLSGVLMVLALSLGGGAWAASAWSEGVAVVVGADTTVRFGPLAESQTAFTLSDGAEVRVVDAKGEWREIRDGAGRRGWVSVRNVVMAP